MASGAPSPADVRQRVAFWTLALFLFAVLAALTITLLSVPFSVKVIAAAAVGPIVALSVTFLYFERQNRRWSYVGAAVLGLAGAILRWAVSTRPSLEVGGGVPPSVTIAYVALGIAVAGTSLWSYPRRPLRPAPG